MGIDTYNYRNPFVCSLNNVKMRGMIIISAGLFVCPPKNLGSFCSPLFIKDSYANMYDFSPEVFISINTNRTIET